MMDGPDSDVNGDAPAPQTQGGAFGAGVIQGRLAWEQALRELLADPGPEFWMFSPDYADWPLNQVEVIARLDAWALGRKQPCIKMLARSFDRVTRNFPRFVRWRTQFAHLIECHSLPADQPAPAEGLWLLGRGVQALPADHVRRAVACDAASLLEARHVFDEAWERSEVDFPATTLGL